MKRVARDEKVLIDLYMKYNGPPPYPNYDAPDDPKPIRIPPMEVGGPWIYNDPLTVSDFATPEAYANRYALHEHNAILIEAGLPPVRELPRRKRPGILARIVTAYRVHKQRMRDSVQ